VVFGINDEAHNAPAYQILAQLSNARLSYSDSLIWFKNYKWGMPCIIFSEMSESNCTEFGKHKSPSSIINVF